MKFLEFHARVTIMKILEFKISYENHEHLRILIENHENQANHKSSTRES